MSSEFDGVRWWRLRSVPRPPDNVRPGRWMAQSIAPTLTAAHAELAGQPGAGILVAWLHTGGDEPYEFLIGGRPYLPAAAEALTGADTPVLFPPGATARALPDGEADQRIARFGHWVRCLGATVAKTDADPAEPDAGQGFDDYVAHLRTPFAWVVVAEPQSDDVLDEELAELTVDLTMLRKREHSEEARIALERGQSRYREFSRARRTGLWSMRVLAGGGTAGTARQAAALLCGAGELDDLSWSMLPSRTVGDLASAWAKPEDGPDGARSPFLAGTDVASRLARGPARELHGLRLVTTPEFDVTPDVDVEPGSGVTLGSILDGGLHPVGDFVVPHDTLNRHGFICGATGSGKSQTARRLLESLATGEHPVPWLVVEPAKAEYARMSGRLRGRADVLVIRPGDPATVPAALNPLEPEPGFPLQSHADLIRALFLAAFEADEPFPQVLSRALTDCYTAAGWDLVTSGSRRPVRPKLRRDEPGRPAEPRYPTLGDLQATARRVVDEIGYGREVAADVRGFVDVRMGSLRQGTPGRFFEGGHPLDIGALLRRNVVLELESITNDQDKAFLMGTVLIRIVEHLRVRAQHERITGLHHVLLIEEAHRLLKNVEDGPAAAAVELFASLLAEIRAYGEGVVVVEQIPAKILPDVIKNTALKIVHRLPAKDDRDAVGATMNLQKSGHEAVVAFPPGRAAVSVDGWDRPLLAQMAGGMAGETPDGCELYPPLRGRRSTLCGAPCRTRACELGEMAAASAVAREPGVVIWSEMTAAAVAIGIEPPHPRPEVRAALVAGDDRTRECALAMVVDTAVDARRARLNRWVDPQDFGVRLHETLTALLAGEPQPDGDVRRWRAGAYRWAYVHGLLEAAVEQVGGIEEARGYEPHPMTGEWHEYGLTLDADSLAGQFEQLQRDPAYALGAEKVALGDVRASGLRDAVLDVAGATGAAWFAQAIRLSCTGGDLEVLIGQVRAQLDEEENRAGQTPTA
jgi:DNA helicase HerA-like ATPase